MPHSPRWYQRAAAWLVFALVRTVSATIRYHWHDPTIQHLRGPAIFCVWHNRLALCLPSYLGYARPRTGTPGMAAMASASKDGALLAAILECFGVEPVRGSTSRRGPQALLELVSWAELGYDLAITPDGPRGPCYTVQPGIMSLAQITGLPIIPCSYQVNWRIRAKSWDRFIVPLPFARCDITVGKAVGVPRDASDAERERLRRELETTLKELSPD